MKRHAYNVRRTFLIQEKKKSSFPEVGASRWIAGLNFQIFSIFTPLKKLKSIRGVVQKAPDESM